MEEIINMYSIPDNLFPSTMLTGQKLFDDSSMMYDVGGSGGDIFFTIKNGNWTDTSIWQTVSGRRLGTLPSANDTVYVRHNIVYNLSNVTLTLNKLYVSGIFTHSGSRNTAIIVNKSFIVHPNGLFDVSNSIYFDLYLLGTDNYCEKQCYINSSFTTIAYISPNSQQILDLNYNNLIVGIFNSGSDTKFATNNLVINGNLIIYGNTAFNKPNLELGQYNLTVLGNTNLSGFLSKSAEGNILFVGTVSSGQFLFNGNPNVEFRSGITLNNNNSIINTGTGVFSFTTNNQTISLNTGTNYTMLASIYVDNNIILTNNTSSQQLLIYNSINGGNGSSQFINKGTLYFMNDTVTTPMTTGIFDTYTFANTIGYVFNGNTNIQQTALSSLYLLGTGTKTLIGDTSLSGNLTMPTPALGNILELGSYDLLVTGDIAIQGGYSSLTRSVANSGKLLRFRNYLGSTSGGVLNVGSTNDIEMTGNNITSQQAVFTCRNFTFSNVSVSTGGAQSLTINGNVIIYDNCTFTNTINFILTSLIGGNGSSTFINTSTGTVTLQSSSTLMSVGIFTQNGSITYNFAGNYTIPFSSFVNLTLTDLTGIKTLSADTICSGFVRVGTSGSNNFATLELDNFDLTAAYIYISGPATSSIIRTPVSTGKLLKFGYFTGGVSSGAINMGTTNDIELTGGTMFTIGNTFTCRTLIISGNITTLGSNQSLIVNGDIFIKSGIIYTHAAISNYLTINGILNGENSASALIMGTNSFLNYTVSTEPMLIGILDTSTNLNTFRYGNNNQDIKGGNYRNLILNGGGIKTLQGNVSVLNTYTLTAPATKNDNGYTFGNP